MRSRGIIFSAPMVRRLLADQKTQTRRIVKPQPELGEHGYQWPSNRARSMVEIRDMGGLSPYGARGDRLWVRESVRWVDGRAVFMADGGPCVIDTWCWKRPTLTAIHMPYGARRLNLEVTGVRVERLHDITEDDAIAEGARLFDDIPDPNPYKQGSRWSMFEPTSTDECLGTARYAFANAWNKINGEGAWDANPLVWVVTFKRVEADPPQPDQLRKGVK